jgi:enoyl-CoA hydratase/carnithine racemase
MIAPESDHIVATTEGRVRTVVINRPEKKNAITLSMYGRLVDELEHAAEDPAIRVVIITGVDGVFTAGNDLADFQKPSDEETTPGVFPFLAALPLFPKPLVAGVNGLAVGIGTTMLLHCDLVYASSEAVFSMPFARLGLTPEAGSSLLFPNVAGLQRATELLMLGEPFDAGRAREVGLVNEIIAPDQLGQRVAQRAEELAALPPAAVRQTKALIRHDLINRLKEVLEREGEVFRERLASPEATEAFAAFFEKRAADFSRFD